MGSHTGLDQDEKDRREIEALLIRYATALDTRDWTLLESCFTPDATADYGQLVGRHEGYPAIERTVRQALASYTATQHLLSNFVIRVDGEEATSVCQLRASHYLPGVPGGEVAVVIGRYHDDLVKNASAWRIRQRRLEHAWREGNLEIFNVAAASRRPN
ncbi:MAG: nuclear transport factor 2 family protein [Acidimicrobiia bacterium]